MALDNLISIESRRTKIAALEAREADEIADNLALITSFILLQAAKATERADGYTAAEVNLLLAGTTARIDAIARQVTIDLGEHLQKMCADMRPFVSAVGSIQLGCDTEPGCLIRGEDIVPLALIVSEIVTNAIKYAHPTGVAGQIDISCRREAGRIVVEIADDGVGLPENLDPKTGGGLGFQVVRALVSQIGATATFHSDSLGLRVVLLLQNGIWSRP